MSSNILLAAHDRAELEDSLLEFKICFIGCSGSGKTSIIRREVKGEFGDDSYTMGCAFQTKRYEACGTNVELQMWDMAGPERFHSLSPMFYRGTCIICIVYCIENRESFNRASYWNQDVCKYIGTSGAAGPKLYLVANKHDLEHQREVSTSEGQKRANEMDAEFVETSAKTGHNIGSTFEQFAEAALSIYCTSYVKEINEWRDNLLLYFEQETSLPKDVIDELITFVPIVCGAFCQSVLKNGPNRKRNITVVKERPEKSWRESCVIQ